jgi:hypothetical protein
MFDGFSMIPVTMFVEFAKRNIIHETIKPNVEIFHVFCCTWVTLIVLSNFIVKTLLTLRCNQNKHETLFVVIKLFTLDSGNNLEQIYI